jgi:MYND finger
MQTPLDKCLVSKIPHAGSGLLARHDITDQELIIKLERPFVCIPVNDMLDAVCYDCLRPKEKLMRCSRCKIVRFCSKDCQRASWAEVHKLECRIFQLLGDSGRPILPSPVRAALQVVLRREEASPPYAPKLLDLVAHEESFDEKALEDIVLQARAVIEYARLPTELMSFVMAVLERVISLFTFLALNFCR